VPDRSRPEGSSIQPVASTEVLTVPEVMAVLKLSRNKIYDLTRTKKLTRFTIGRSRRIPADAVRTFIHQRIEEAN
jgi:excisionase family DNA binding protein